VDSEVPAYLRSYEVRIATVRDLGAESGTVGGMPSLSSLVGWYRSCSLDAENQSERSSSRTCLFALAHLHFVVLTTRIGVCLPLNCVRQRLARSSLRFGLNYSHSCATDTRYRTLMNTRTRISSRFRCRFFSHTYTRTHQLLTSLASAPEGGFRIDSTHIQEKLMGTQTPSEVLDATTRSDASWSRLSSESS
jgi:hypothetical protein